MTALLVIAAILLGCVGALFLSQATTGVGIIAFACLLAILARITQASDHHQAQRAAASADRPGNTMRNPHGPTIS